MCEQTCADCRGVGYQLVGFTGTMPRFGDSLCPTCDGTGAILRTGPYRLADGTWSDGVDRSQPVREREAKVGRWEVWRNAFDGWVVDFDSGKIQGSTQEEFPTHTEGIAYADRMARTNQGEK